MDKNVLVVYTAIILYQNVAILCYKNSYQVAYEWSVINFTWPSKEEYIKVVTSKEYIPEYNVISGIKIHKKNIYLALPRCKNETPVTLGTFTTHQKNKKNVLLKPYPSWDMNVKKNCSTLQNVQSMKIDSNGVMWVIDGIRSNNLSLCPQKLVLLDLTKKGKVVHMFQFPFAISSFFSGHLTDLVIDETDGGFAYITDSSYQDPGIIIYSRKKDKAWKIRDAIMFPEKASANFSINGVKYNGLYPVNAIALSPRGNVSDVRLVYFSPLTGFKIHAISNDILKDEDECKTSEWRNQVKFIADKSDRSGAYGMDNKGSPLSECSRVSKEAYFESRNNDLIYIKEYQKEKWIDYDDEDETDYYKKSCSTLSRRSSARSSAKTRDYAQKRAVFFTERSSTDDLKSLGSYRSSTCNSVYVPATPTKTKLTSNKFLDWITMCFWKCSPGCQQLPTLKV